MDLKEWKNKALHALHRHKYALVILAVGLVMMLIPLGTDTQNTEQVRQTQSQEQTQSVQQQLQHVLSKIRGAGEVEVLLTVASGAQTVYQEDADITAGENETARHDTVIIRDSNGGESGLVQQVIPATYLGAVVVCQGADSASVRLAIVEAVSKATGLGADQISVLKMK